eukprot:scaffold13668_cov91-Cylindrotheca_fusiformis.AAC.2
MVQHHGSATVICLMMEREKAAETIPRSSFGIDRISETRRMMHHGSVQQSSVRQWNIGYPRLEDDAASWFRATVIRPTME